MFYRNFLNLNVFQNHFLFTIYTKAIIHFSVGESGV